MLLDAGAQHQYCLLLFDKLCLQPLVGTGRVLQFGLVLMEFLLEVLDVLFEVGDYGAAGGTGHFGGAQLGLGLRVGVGVESGLVLRGLVRIIEVLGPEALLCFVLMRVHFYSMI